MIVDVASALLRPECYHRYFEQYDFLDASCFKQLLSKCLGYAIVTGALIVKLPQIIKIVQSGRADSLAPSMFILENIGFTITTAYNYRHRYPFSTYGESVFLLVQGFALVLLVFRANKQLNARFFAGVFAYLAFAYACFFQTSLPALATLQSLSIPIFAASRLPQIYNNYRDKSTGQLAFVTTVLNAAGSAARVFTTVQEVNDPVILVGTLIGTALNSVILAQMLTYWNNSKTATTARSKASKAKDVSGAGGGPANVAVAKQRSKKES